MRIFSYLQLCVVAVIEQSKYLNIVYDNADDIVVQAFQLTSTFSCVFSSRKYESGQPRKRQKLVEKRSSKIEILTCLTSLNERNDMIHFLSKFREFNNWQKNCTSRSLREGLRQLRLPGGVGAEREAVARGCRQGNNLQPLRLQSQYDFPGKLV